MERNRLRQLALPTVLFFGDALCAFGGVSLAWWLRYDSRIAHFGLPVEGATFALYLPLLLVGVALLIASYAQLGLYDEKLLLRRYQSLAIIIKGTVFWLVAYLCVSLVLKFNPPISRLFVIVAFACVVVFIYSWRSIIYLVVTRGSILERMQQRVAILGWNSDAERLLKEVSENVAHPYQIVGIISEKESSGPNPREFLPALVIGHIGELERVLRLYEIDVLIAAHLDFERTVLNSATVACERTYTEFKIIPSVFQVFVSGLRMQTIGTIPVLGVEDLPITRLFNRILKRFVDFAGAAVGLVVSAPIIVVLAFFIYRESPGRIFFRQERIGMNHRRFVMWKLRSMRLDASLTDHVSQSTRVADPRLLRIGAWMRRWNLDELPQFWNVLCGHMSLVGPRPERTFHVEKLSDEIPHYLPRHLVRPGMTGWAQVNGLRGSTDLAKRIQHDIYYIENWSLWLDAQILLLTFVRWQNASESSRQP